MGEQAADQVSVDIINLRAPKMTEMTLKKFLAHVIPTQNIFCKKIGPKWSFVASAVVRPIYIRLYGATAAN